MLHIIVACYFPTPNLIYTPILKAQTLNLALFLKAQALNLTLFLKAQALNLALLLKAEALNLALYLKSPGFKPGTDTIQLPYFQT